MSIRIIQLTSFLIFIQLLAKAMDTENWMYALLALCEGNALVINGFPSQRVSNAESIFLSWYPYHTEREGCSHLLLCVCCVMCNILSEKFIKMWAKRNQIFHGVSNMMEKSLAGQPHGESFTTICEQISFCEGVNLQMVNPSWLICSRMCQKLTEIARFMWPTWGPSGANRTQVGPMLAPMNLDIWEVISLQR